MKHTTNVRWVLSFCLLSLCQWHLLGADLESEVAQVSKNVVAAVGRTKLKKVAVIDFVDLQGNQSEFGRFMAEQLTLEIVMQERSFTMIDRANLKKLLDEHKLTVSGLVEPENAKKLGQFSGVDGLILGTVTPMEHAIAVSVKVIATDTAEILGGARGKIDKTAELVELLARTAAEGATEGSLVKPAARNTQTSSTSPESQRKQSAPGQKFGNVVVTLDRLQHLNDGSYLVDLTFQNTGNKNPVAVAFHYGNVNFLPCELGSLVGTDGSKYLTYTSAIKGIQATSNDPGPLVQIDADNEIKTSVRFSANPNERPSGVPDSFRLQMEFVVNPNYNAVAGNNNYSSSQVPPGCRLYNLVLDIPTGVTKTDSQ